jgi:hypothetical protein
MSDALMERHWKQREKEIESVLKNSVGLYGDMLGIVGDQILAIPSLELDSEITKQLPNGSNAEPQSDTN